MKFRIILFLVLLLLNTLFPFYGDDLVAVQVREQLGIVESIRWFYNGSNPRIQNILVLFFTFKNTLLHNVFSSFIFVLFIEQIKYITKASYLNIYSILLLGIVPAIWTDLYLAAPSFYNHFIGFNIGLFTYIAFDKNYSNLIKLILVLVLSNTGLLIAIPFIVLLYIKFRNPLLFVSIIGLVIFLLFQGSYVRSYSDNLSLYAPIDAFYKLLEAKEYIVLLAFLLIISSKNYENIIWHITGVVTMLFIAILPIEEIGMGRWTGITLLFHCIGTLHMFKYNLKKVFLIPLFIYSIGLARFNLTNFTKTDDFLYNYTINIEYNLWTKEKFDERIKLYNENH